MLTDAESGFDDLMKKAADYDRRALWQEKLHTLQRALQLCQASGALASRKRKQQILSQLGGLRRRFGQYDLAIRSLQEALDSCESSDAIGRSTILGELGVVYQNIGWFPEARRTFQEQYQIVQDSGDGSIAAEAQLCRAAGNDGASAYNFAMQQEPIDVESLHIAARQLKERVTRAQNLILRLQSTDPASEYVAKAKAWETIGLDRLALCEIALGDPASALHLTFKSQSKQSGDDPTTAAMSSFYHGYALWSNGHVNAALANWNAIDSKCSSLTAFCKEPSVEHVRFVKILCDAGVDIERDDDQGYSAFDYIAFSDSDAGQSMLDIIQRSLRKRLSSLPAFQVISPAAIREKHLDAEIDRRRRQAVLRREYRIILQEHFRPELERGNNDSIQRLRSMYAELRSSRPILQAMLDGLYYIKYTDLKTLGRLPSSSESISKRIAYEAGPQMDADLYIVFISYRWLGQNNPDDETNSQWQRTINAVDDFLRKHGAIEVEDLGIWLDRACIDQIDEANRERGIDALPLAVAQCNALISLVDETFYTRAWCAVEMMLFRELSRSYGLHGWWEHVLLEPDTDRCRGVLQTGMYEREVDPTRLDLSKPLVDRPKVDFLVRQSRLLRRGNVQG